MERMRPTTDTRRTRVPVLIVERHADTRNQLAKLLTGCGFEVHTVDSCAAAREFANRSIVVPRIVVSEIWLSDGDGVELLRELKQRFACGTIAHTTCGSQEDIARCRAAGIDRHLLKPLGVRELPGAIRAMAA